MLGHCCFPTGCLRCGTITSAVSEANFVQSTGPGGVQYHRTGSVTHPSNPFQSFVSSTDYWGSTLTIVDGNGNPVGISSKQIIDRTGSSTGPNPSDQGFTWSLGPSVDLRLLGLEAHGVLLALDFNGTPLVTFHMRNPPSVAFNRPNTPCMDMYAPHPFGPPIYPGRLLNIGACAWSGNIDRQFGAGGYTYRGLTSQRVRVMAGSFGPNSCLVSYAGPLENGLIVLRNSYVTNISPLTFSARILYDIPLPSMPGNVERFTVNVFDEFCQINPFV